MAVDSVASKTVTPITPIAPQLTTKTADVDGEFATTLDKIEKESSLISSVGNGAAGASSTATSGKGGASVQTGGAKQTQVANQAAAAKTTAASGYDSIAPGTEGAEGYDSLSAGGSTGAGASQWSAAEDAVVGATAAASYGTAIAAPVEAKSFAADRGVDLSATLALLREWMGASAAAGAGSASDGDEDEDNRRQAAAQAQGSAAATPSDALSALDLGQGRFALVGTGQEQVEAKTPVLDFYTNTVQPADRSERPKPIVPAGLSSVQQKNVVAAFDEADHYGLLRNRADFLANLDAAGKPVRDVDELAQWIKSGKVGDPPLPLDMSIKKS